MDFWLFWIHFMKFSILSSHFYHVWHIYHFVFPTIEIFHEYAHVVFHLQTGLALFIDLFIDCRIIFNSFPRDENFSPVCSCSNLGEIWSRVNVTAILFLHCFHLLCAISNKLAFCTINIMYLKTHFHLGFSIQNNRF